MVKKMILAFGVVALGLAGLPGLNQSYASTNAFVTFNGELSGAEKLLVCCELADQKILDLNTALAAVRDGSLTITKLDSGIYRVVLPGGLGDIILIIDD